MSVVKQRIFDGWSSVPREYKPRAAWKRDCRRIGKGEKPSASVITKVVRKLECTGGQGEYSIEKS
jgi:hypothetical protein